MAKMVRGVTAASTFAMLADVASTSSVVMLSGYTPLSDVSSQMAVGTSLEVIAAALGETPRDWDAALLEYTTVRQDASLRMLISSPPARGTELYDTFASYYQSDTYVHEFVFPALKGEGVWEFVDEKAREELTMKGLVLQGVLMASISNLLAATTSCGTGADSAQSRIQLVDRAWTLYACSESQGPIRLAEKRSPQFGTEAVTPSDAGVSVVNEKLLTIFQQLQSNAQGGNCTAMKLLGKQAVAQMQVPVIQGLLREAYEVDPKEAEQHGGADGFIEVVEGWAFARAVLPAIAQCSTDAADIIVKNMDTIVRGVDGPHLEDGYMAVKAAVESTYECLGISCSDVNAMINFHKTDQFLWEACNASTIGTAPKPSKEAGEETVTVAAAYGGRLGGIVLATTSIATLVFAL